MAMSPVGQTLRQAGIIGFFSGPTSSGKSSLALQIAEKYNLSILSADSMQVYHGLTIGTGALSVEDRKGIPHGLIGVCDPWEEFHAGRFVLEGLAFARHQLAQGRRTLVVGGTGMWIQSLREGLMQGPGRDETIRAKWRKFQQENGSEELYQALVKTDPETAEKLTPNDQVRIIRALEVFELTGKPHARWIDEDLSRKQTERPFLPLIILDVPRQELYKNINQRVIEMISAGWLDEAKELMALNLPSHLPAGKALGYPNLFQVLRGEINLDSAIPAIQQETRRYAKRQLTWFRGQVDSQWVSPNDLIKVESILEL